MKQGMGEPGKMETQPLLAGLDGGDYHYPSASRSSPTIILVLSALTAASIAFNTRCTTGYSSPTQSAIMQDLGLSVAEFSLFGSLETVGLFLGGLLSGKVTDFLGHKSIMWILSSLSILAWLAIALAKLGVSLCFLHPHNIRFLIYHEGSLAALPGKAAVGIWKWNATLCGTCIYCGELEISPNNLRGRFAALAQMAVIWGIAFMYVMGSFVSWRTLALVGTLVNVLRLPFLFLVPYSPRWLAKVGQEEDIASSLQCLRGKQVDVSQEATDIREFSESLVRFSKGGFLDLFQRNYANSLIIGIGILALHNSVGANAYVSYSGVVFVSAGASSFIGLISRAAVQTFSGIWTCILIDKFGRRPLLLVSSAGACLGSFITGLSFLLQDFDLWKDGTPVLAVISVLLFIGFYALGLGAIPWILVAEIFPMNVKGEAASIGAAVSQLCSWVVAYYFNFWLEWSSAGTFFIFSAICAANYVFVAVLLPETKGNTLEEIQGLLAHRLRQHENLAAGSE